MEQCIRKDHLDLARNRQGLEFYYCTSVKSLGV